MGWSQVERVRYIVINQVIHGDCLDILPTLPSNYADLIFADPPYNLQLRQELIRPNGTVVSPVNDEWDKFSGFEAYDQFSYLWLSQCYRILKSTGCMWVSGTYHNIYRIGAVMQDLNYWILNDVIWVKSNPMPNFAGVRFTNAHETLIWATKSNKSKYTFHYWDMKRANDNKQMRSDWRLPICQGNERLKVNGSKAHPTQKPEALLERIILATSNPGDLVLDPFFGTGTTGAVAQWLHRDWLGIEQEANYVELATNRLSLV